MVKQILLVTEGVSEGDLLKKLFKRFCSEKVEIVEFKTNIYQLYDCYESYHCRYDQLDLRKVLLEHCTRLKLSEKERLKKNFSEIYLIFDMDPQDPLYSREKLIKLHSHFSDPSDYGKLYINYPMVESFYHIEKGCYQEGISDVNFSNSKFSVKNLSCYKKNVSEEGFRIFNANPPSLIARAIQQHIDKFKLIEKITLVDAEITHKELESFLKKQCSMVVDEQRGYILNTACFAISELYPKKLAETLKNK